MARACGFQAASSLNTPRSIWSASIDSNSALKLPSPKPSSLLRAFWRQNQRMLQKGRD